MTHDAVGHQMTARRHVGGHLRSLHKWTELGILEHEIGAHDRAIRSPASPIGVGLSSSPVTTFCNVLFTPSGADDEICIRHFGTGERDARTSPRRQDRAERRKRGCRGRYVRRVRCGVR